jgi:hypothetical protein
MPADVDHLLYELCGSAAGSVDTTAPLAHTAGTDR